MAGIFKSGIEAAKAIFASMTNSMMARVTQVQRVFAVEQKPVEVPDGNQTLVTLYKARLDDGAEVRPLITRFRPAGGRTYTGLEWAIGDGRRRFFFPVDTTGLDATELLPPDQNITKVIWRLRKGKKSGKLEPVAYHETGKVILPANGYAPTAYTDQQLREMREKLERNPQAEQPVVYRVALVEKPGVFVAYEVPTEPNSEMVSNCTALALLEEIEGGTIPQDLYTIYDGGRRYEVFDQLGLSTDATMQQVRDAYYRKAKSWHPNTVEQVVSEVREKLEKEKGKGVEVPEAELRAAVKQALQEAVQKKAEEFKKLTGLEPTDLTRAEFERAILVLNMCYDRAVQICQHRKRLELMEKLKANRCTGQTKAGQPCKSQRWAKGADTTKCAQHQPDPVTPPVDPVVGDQPEVSK